MNSALYKISVWITRLTWLNILWLFFSLLGVVIAGFFPATVAMFGVARCWIKNDVDVPVFRMFWYIYKKSFLEANVIGILLMGAGYLLYIDIMLFKNMASLAGNIFMMMLLTTGIIYAIIALFIFPIKVEYEKKTWETIKFALIIGISSPLPCIFIGISVCIVWYISALFPIALLLFSGSVLSMMIMHFANLAFERIEKKMMGQLSNSRRI